MHPRRPLTLLALLLASLSARPALAQSPELTGIARAVGDKHVLSCIRVALDDSAGRELAFTRTDWRGLFAIAAPRAGVYRLRFDSPVTAPMLGPVDTVADGAYLERVYELPFIWSDSAVRARARRGEYDLRPLVNPAPHYPDGLRDKKIEGEALAEFVVDSAGAVDSESVRIVRATQPEFGAAVADALGKTIYQPPHDHGVAVCQRFMQPFVFRLGR